MEKAHSVRNLPVSCCVHANLPTDILNGEQLGVVLTPNKCKDVSQGSEGTDAVCLRVSLQKTRFTETKSSPLRIFVACSMYFVDVELRNRCDVLVTTETVTYFCYPQAAVNVVYFKVYPSLWLERLRKTTRYLRTAGLQVENRTRTLLNTKQ